MSVPLKCSHSVFPESKWKLCSTSVRALIRAYNLLRCTKLFRWMILDARTSVLPMHKLAHTKSTNTSSIMCVVQLCIFVLLAVCALHCCSRALFRRPTLRRAPTHTQAVARAVAVRTCTTWQMTRVVGKAARVSESSACECE